MALVKLGSRVDYFVLFHKLVTIISNVFLIVLQIDPVKADAIKDIAS